MRMREQSKAIVKACVDVLDRQHVQSRCGQLDCERDSVEPPAHLDNGARVVIGDRERGIDRCRALDEQMDGLVFQKIGGADA